MAQADTVYSARFTGIETIERSRANTIKCPVYLNGALVAPTGGTVSVYREDGSAVVDAQTVTVSGSVAQYTVSALTAESYSDRWQVEWTLTISGTAYIFCNEAALVKKALAPVITDTDLLRRHSDLNDLRPSGQASFQNYLDEAWATILSRLVQAGRFPWLVMSPSAFREPHLYLTLELIFRDFAGSGDGENKWAVLAEHYAQKFTEVWKDLTFHYDEDRDGLLSDRRKAAGPTIWLTGRG